MNKEYFNIIGNKIETILSRKQQKKYTYDILDTKLSINNKEIVLREKQRQMKIGEIWQEVLGNYDGFVNLGKNHPCGLDILSTKHKIAIELKNRTNTDNSSSKKANFDKLAKFKKTHPEYTCIYANINTNSKENMSGYHKTILHNYQEIHHMVGYVFLRKILGIYMDEVIHFIREKLEKASQNNETPTQVTTNRWKTINT